MPEILQLDFMVRAFVAGGVVGITAPTLGVFLVLRRLSLIAETLAHVAVTGAAIGLLLGRYPVAIAVVTSALAAVLLERLRASRKISSDSAMAIILYAALALALVMISRGQGLNVNLLGFLFGSIVTVSPADVWATSVLGAAVLVLVWLRYSDLIQSTFDPDLAQVSGVPVGQVNTLLAVLTGVMVTLSMRVMGGLLIGALIVIPVLASLALNRGLRTTLLVAALIGLAAVFAGLTVSYYMDVAASGAIVITALAILGAVTAFRAILLRFLRRPLSSPRTG